MGSTNCNGSLTMDTFSMAPWVGAVTQARFVTVLGVGVQAENPHWIMSYREYMTTAGSVIPKGRVAWGICNSWVKQPLGLWCWGIPLLAVDLMLRWASEKLRSDACHGIWCYAGKMPIRWVSGWLWVNCTTSAECKTIWIAESSVMDGWDDR
jgi:hypothetical protein